MPASTLPYEIVLTVLNDTSDTIQLISASSQAGVYLEASDHVSLVLTAGSTYRYTLKQFSPNRKAQMSVRAWNDLHCLATSVFAGSHS
ncbi:hypothetical protein MKEN_00827400 [Mycena kentingensis (nom. inval.)]|nr:hypothetical protein MKEN_00827400 [Mycena kentingensis (nom. inval.)]